MTYAAGLKAVTIVWIADRFTEEHRAAMDWLNEISDDRFNFFGLEIEAWRIGDSPIAPKFNVVCKPNDWTKSVNPIGDNGGLTETKILQREYWAALAQLLKDRKSIVRPQKPLPQHWTNFALGRSNLSLRAAVNTQKKAIWVYVVCYGNDGKAHFHLLKREQEAIEEEVGCALQWEELPGRKESRIELRREDVDPTNQSGWSHQHAWMAERLEALHKAFSVRVKTLDASEYDEDLEDL